MRIEARLSLSPQEVSKAIFDNFWGLFPEFRSQTPGGPVLFFKLPVEDPRLGVLQQTLSRAGFVPWENRFRAALPNEYALRLERVYEPADWDAAEFLIPRPKAAFAAARNDEQGRMLVQADRYENRAAMEAEVAGDPVDPILYVTSRVKATFEAARLEHLVFAEAVLIGGNPDSDDDLVLPWPDPLGNRWTLTSDWILPAAERSNMVNGRGEPFTGNPKGGCLLNQGLYTPAELHFRRKELAAAVPFGPHGRVIWPRRWQSPSANRV